MKFLEFLANYGWAILVILIAIGALAYFGVIPRYFGVDSHMRYFICHEDVINRKAIQNYDYVLEYIEEGKIEEASRLADAIGTYHWHLRNCDGLTEEYDEIMDKDSRWFIASNIERCDETLPNLKEACFERIKQIIKDFQAELYVRSDIEE